jgi:hypothetical protein
MRPVKTIPGIVYNYHHNHCVKAESFSFKFQYKVRMPTLTTSIQCDTRSKSNKARKRNEMYTHWKQKVNLLLLACGMYLGLWFCSSEFYSFPQINLEHIFIHTCLIFRMLL